MGKTLPRSEIQDLAILSAEMRCRFDDRVVFGTLDHNRGGIESTRLFHRSHSLDQSVKAPRTSPSPIEDPLGYNKEPRAG